MTKFNDLAGQTFGRLLVLSRAESGKSWKTRFNCVCECGSHTVVFAQSLLRGYTKSCGCWKIEAPHLAFTTHGMTRVDGKGVPEYRAWCHLKTRCLNQNNPAYPRYGGRGITVCDEWKASFESFYRDMGPRPSPRHSVERIDGNAGYLPGNCCWALPGVQAINRIGVRLIEFNGVTDSMAGWARRTGIPYLRLRRRIVDGWPLERVLESKDCGVRSAIHREPG
jgi:hypothetical protein